MELNPSMVSIPKQKKEIKSSLILGMCSIYMVQFFTHSHFLTLCLSILTVIVFIVSLPDANPIPRMVGIGMFISGVICNILKGTGFEATVNGMTANSPLLTLLILVPLLSIPLKMAGYFDSIQFFMKRWIVHSRKIFASISVFMFILGPILNLGSVRIMHDMIKDLRLNPILISKSELVGFSTVILWSPYFASVALVLYNLHVSVIDYLPLGLSFAVLQLVIGNLLFWHWQAKQGHLAEAEVQMGDIKDSWPHRQNTKKLLGLVVFLMAAILILEQLTKWPMMYLVSLMATLYPVFWCTYKRKWREATGYFQEYRIQTVGTMNNDMVMFISAGLFGKALTGTAFADGIRWILNQISAMSFLLFIITVMATILISAFVGVHQIVVVTALVTQMDSAVIGTSPEVLALLLMVSWTVSSVTSPINPLNLIVSGYVKQPALTVGLKWNGVYLLVMLITGGFFIYLIH